MDLHIRLGFVPHLYNPRGCCRWCGHVVGLSVQKASQCAHEIRPRGEGRRRGEEQQHVAFVIDAEGRGDYCIHAQAALTWMHPPLLLHLPPSVIPPLVHCPTQLGQVRPPQAAETTMYRITWKEQRAQFKTKASFTAHTSAQHTHQKHHHDDDRQLEVLHTHGSCQVTTCGLKRDWLKGVQREINHWRSAPMTQYRRRNGAKLTESTRLSVLSISSSSFSPLWATKSETFQEKIY